MTHRRWHWAPGQQGRVTCNCAVGPDHERQGDPAAAPQEQAEVQRLRSLLLAALPIVEYVSNGRCFVDCEPYPETNARRVNATLRNELRVT